MTSLEDLRAAADRIAPHVLRTPLVRLPLDDDEVWAKAESLQRTNSFKLRGATNFLARLEPEVRARGVCAHSSGNHAQGVAAAARAFGVPAAIAIPEGAPETKVARTRALGAEVVRCGGSSEEREAAAARFVRERGYTLVPPFDHPWIIEGQGTAGLELLEDLPEVANVLVCVGGGGLISGVATAVKALRPEARVIGVEPELAADATESFRRGRLVSWPAERTTRTVADGTRTQAIGAANLEVILARVDAFVTVPDEAILAAARFLLLEAKLAVEPTGALALAGYRALREGTAVATRRDGGDGPLLREGPTAVLVSGGNADPATVARLAAGPDELR